MISTSRLGTTKTDEDRSDEAIAFIAEVDEVCRRHGFAIWHEDSHGAFQVGRSDDNDWFLGADEFIPA